MKPERFDQLLKATLQDDRLSRGEKRALAEELKDLDPDDKQVAFLRHRAFEVARGELIGPEALKVLDWLEEVLKLLQPSADRTSELSSAAYFSPDDEPGGQIVRLLKSAQKTVDICVFTITDDRITKAVLAAHRRGVAVRIITDNEKADDRGSDIDRLQRAGVPLRTDRSQHHMHHKFALFDGRRILTGSYNWTRSAARNNEENLIVTDDAGLVDAFDREFARLWERLG